MNSRLKKELLTASLFHKFYEEKAVDCFSEVYSFRNQIQDVAARSTLRFVPAPSQVFLVLSIYAIIGFKSYSVLSVHSPAHVTINPNIGTY